MRPWLATASVIATVAAFVWLDVPLGGGVGLGLAVGWAWIALRRDRRRPPARRDLGDATLVLLIDD
jgi:hypothetical protein